MTSKTAQLFWVLKFTWAFATAYTSSVKNSTSPLAANDTHSKLFLQILRSPYCREKKNILNSNCMLEDWKNVTLLIISSAFKWIWHSWATYELTARWSNPHPPVSRLPAHNPAPLLLLPDAHQWHSNFMAQQNPLCSWISKLAPSRN